MKNKLMGIVVGMLTLVIFQSEASAATYYRTATVNSVQAESANRTGYENVVWIDQSGGWSGGSCKNVWAYFKADENPHLMSIALAARMGGTPLKVVVDEAKPTIDGYCQIVNMSL